MNFEFSQSKDNLRFAPAPQMPGASADVERVVRVLLVDDDEDEFLIVRGLLGQSAATPGALRFSLEWTDDGNAALAQMASSSYDAYLVDYRLGAATGLQIIECAVKAGCDAPLILLSGQDDPRVDAQAMHVGATDYLVKDQLSGALLERTLRYAIAGKQSERELRAAAARNARLMAAIEGASVGVSLTEMQDDENRVAYVNPAFTHMTGYPPSEIIGQTLSLLGGRKTAPEQVERVRQQMLDGEACEGMALNFRRDGTPFWNEAHFAPIPVAPGEPAGHVGFFQDVTARVEAENAAAEARRNLENAQALTHLGSWIYEYSLSQSPPLENVASESRAQQGAEVFSWWSDETFRIIGYEPQSQSCGAQLWMEAVHPEDRDFVLGQIERTISGETPFDYECRLLRDSGEVRHVQVRVIRERDASEGITLRLAGTILDITERTRAELAERELSTRLQTVTATAPIILWALDCDGFITFSEGHILYRLGLEPGQIVGQSVFDVYADNPNVIEVCRRALDGEVCEEIAYVQGRTFAVYVAPRWNENHEQIGVVGISHDITEQFQAQQALLESEARFERIMPNVPGMVFRFERKANGEQNFLYVSEACREMFGVAPEAALQDAELLLGTIVPEEQASFRRSVVQSAHSLDDWKLEMNIALPTGEKRWIRGEARPIELEKGAIVWDGILIDLTANRAAAEALQQSESALDEAQKLAHIGSFTWNLRTGETLWSDEMYRMFEIEIGAPVPAPEEAIARYHPDDCETLMTLMQERSVGRGADDTTVRLVRRDGTIRYLETRVSLQYDDDGEPLIMTGSLQDVTARVEAERALRESEERYALAARGTNDGLWDWNLVADEIYYSSHWKAMLGYADDAIGNAPDEWLGRIHPDDIGGVRAHIDAHLRGQNAQCECEYRLQNEAGEYRWMLGRGQALFNEEGVATRLSGSQTDITERKIAENQLEYNAFYDTALTNLPNRALFAERLDRTIARGNRNPEHTFAVLFLDIDRFKKINDSLGHMTGDRLLIEASARFQKCVRPGDTVARFGGDEFAILLDDVGGIDDVNQVADRIHAELDVPFQLDGHEPFVTVSMGIVLGQGDTANAEELLRSADTAMYRAKGAGRGRHEIFEATMRARAVKMLEMETDLWRALERDELRLHYQPIIELEGGKICGLEALVRWQHPERGLVSPGDFIPLAEESGLIVPIGWWVLEEACRQALAWQGEFGPMWMSVNLSPKQLSQPDIFERVQGALERTGLDPHLLKLEVTESVFMENTAAAARMLQQIKQMGVRFSMDDFGTGYSSLSYLHRFPLDTIKIDRSFVSQMQPGARDHQIVNTIVSMARGLKMEVVAEGVETAQQLADLREMRCGYAQGFYMSRPQPHAQIEELLGRGLSW